MVNQLRFRRGAPISVDLEIEDAEGFDPAELTVAMDLKPAMGSGVPDASVAKVASFAMAYVPAAGAAPGYWRGTIPAGVAATLTARSYVTDALITLAGVVIDVTDDLAIEITGRVTEP